MLPGHEVADDRADDGRASQPAADQHAEADLALFVLHDPQADVVHPGRGAVLPAAADRDLELARQVGELGMERGPLAQDLGIGTRIDDLVARGRRRTRPR